MKKTIFLLLWILPLQADFSVSGEYLYLNASLDHSIYAVKQEQNHQTLIERDCNWHSGYRLIFGYLPHTECIFQFKWTHLDFEQHKNSQGNLALSYLDPVTFQGGKLFHENEQSYDIFELIGVFTSLSRYCYRMQAIAGLIATRLKNDEKEKFFNQMDTLAIDAQRKSSSWGIGPEIGGTFETQFCRRLFFEAEAAVSLLVTQNKFDYSSNLLQLNQDNCAHVVPYLFCKAGLSYKFCCYICSHLTHFALRANYNFIYLHEPLFTVFGIGQGGFNLEQDLSLQGPAIGIEIQF